MRKFLVNLTEDDFKFMLRHGKAKSVQLRQDLKLLRILHNLAKIDPVIAKIIKLGGE